MLEDTHEHFKKGDILVFEKDDGTSSPLFKRLSDNKINFCLFNRLEYADEPKISNTIITNITSPEQHKKVQEKLFGMGYHWSGLKVGEYFDNYRKDLKNYCIDLSGPFHPMTLEFSDESYYRIKNPNSRFIPASEFLEEELGTLTEQSLQRAISYFSNQLEPTFVYGKSLYNKLNNPTPTPRDGNGIKKVMSNILQFAKNLTLSVDEKLLRKYGLHDENGARTSTAEDLIEEKMFADNEPYLIETAKAMEAEEKASK
jgi:hypothetical protein